MSKNSWSLEGDGDTSLDPSTRADEPRARKAPELWYYPGGVFSFLLRFAVVLAIFLLAVWIAYLAR
jgi:hypothetical protein